LYIENFKLKVKVKDTKIVVTIIIKSFFWGFG